MCLIQNSFCPLNQGRGHVDNDVIKLIARDAKDAGDVVGCDDIKRQHFRRAGQYAQPIFKGHQ